MAKKHDEVPTRGGRLVRDSFTIPAREYRAIDTLKQRYLALGIHMKKSEILRAGLLALSSMNSEDLAAVGARVERIKPGRPKKSD